jgi:hypothetical protein
MDGPVSAWELNKQAVTAVIRSRIYIGISCPPALINTEPQENGKTRKTKFISLLYLQNNYSKQNIVPIKYK